MATQTLLTAEQFLELPEEEGIIRELDEGRLVEMAPPNLTHGIMVSRVSTLLTRHVEKKGAGFWVVSGPGFQLATEILRIPDAFLIRKSAADSMDTSRGWYEGVPDLVVEVVSPSDKASDLDRRVHQYLSAGASALWVFYPETRHVMVFHQNGRRLDLREGQDLTLPDLLPELRIEVSRIFEGL